MEAKNSRNKKNVRKTTETLLLPTILPLDNNSAVEQWYHSWRYAQMSLYTDCYIT